VEVAGLSAGVVGIRDSKNPDGPHLAIRSPEFSRLVRHLKG
jgi:hypothetical protein